MKKVKWFQLGVILSSVILLAIMIGSAIFAHTRRSGMTGLDAGDIQRLRIEATKEKASRLTR